VRMALVEYINDPDRKFISNPNKKLLAAAYDYIKDDYPFVDPNDEMLVMLMSKQKAKEAKQKKAGYNTYDEEM